MLYEKNKDYLGFEALSALDGIRANKKDKRKPSDPQL